MPALGLAAVPLPTKNRRIAPGYQPANVAADGDPTAAADRPLTNSPVDTDAAGAAVRAAPPNSRRDAAATVHANGPAPDPSPEPPDANHANRFELTPRTPPAAARAAVITGADAAAGEANPTTGADEPSLTASTESTTGTTESTRESAPESDADRLAESATTPAELPTPDTTELGRG